MASVSTPRGYTGGEALALVAPLAGAAPEGCHAYVVFVCDENGDIVGTATNAGSLESLLILLTKAAANVALNLQQVTGGAPLVGETGPADGA
jgi:hypothetical protein